LNIFFLDPDPIKAAQYQCDKHVVKMVTETAQIICTIAHKFCILDIPYKSTHKNHPCVLWAGDSMENLNWLIVHGKALSMEYTRRYSKVHKCNSIFNWAERHIKIPSNGFTTPAQCMPVELRRSHTIENVVMSYRDYYKRDKSRFAKWKLNNIPNWW
jgi:hypothetical protein